MHVIRPCFDQVDPKKLMWIIIFFVGKSTISFRISATFSSNNFLTIYNSCAWRWSIFSAFCSSSSIAQTIAELHEQSTGFNGYQSGSRQIKSDAAPSTKRIPTSFTAVIIIQQPNVANEESTSFSTFTWIGTTTALYFIYWAYHWDSPFPIPRTICSIHCAYPCEVFNTIAKTACTIS